MGGVDTSVSALHSTTYIKIKLHVGVYLYEGLRPFLQSTRSVEREPHYGYLEAGVIDSVVTKAYYQ